VLVAANFENDAMIHPDLEQWNKFLTSRNATDMQVEIRAEGFYEAYPSANQISVPLEVFSCLEKIGPYYFNAFIRSSNLFIPRTVRRSCTVQ
jgi:hypothetical protein